MHYTEQRRIMCETIARHMREKGAWEGCTGMDIFNAAADDPDGLHKLSCWWFDALAYLKEQNHCESLDDIADPQKGERYYVRSKGRRDIYRWEGGWVHESEIMDSWYK
jgi:hypothetical protein